MAGAPGQEIAALGLSQRLMAALDLVSLMLSPAGVSTREGGSVSPQSMLDVACCSCYPAFTALSS